MPNAISIWQEQGLSTLTPSTVGLGHLILEGELDRFPPPESWFKAWLKNDFESPERSVGAPPAEVHPAGE